MARETMSPREGWLAVFKREKPDRVPTDFWGTDEAVAVLMAHLSRHVRYGLRERMAINKALHGMNCNISTPSAQRV